MKTKRLSISAVSSILLALVVAVSCTVKSVEGEDDGDGSNDCTPGRSAACSCSNGDPGMQVCNAQGTGYLSCNCEDGSGGASTNSGGSTSSGGSGAYGGTTAYGGEGGAWVDPGAGGAAGDTSMGGAAAGGAPGTCEDPGTACESCYYQKCCAELEACLLNDICVEEFIDMRDCSNKAVEMDGLASPADVDACAPNGNDDGNWPGDHQEETRELIDCMNGGVGWEFHETWPEGACKDECYVE
jgi:hypothetical protein